ncbi:UNVERIFIED_CONTAM: uncharacterized protein DUF1624 [Acetivibrio alkalicellulosi]
MKIISQTPINIEKQEELDIAKGLAVLFMICAHVLEVLANNSTQNHPIYWIIMLLATVPAAPVFMIAMGVGSVYSRNQKASSAMKRGFILLIMAYLLNTFRGFLPALVGLHTGRMILETIPYENPLMLLLETDILHLAAITFMFFGFLRILKLKWYWYPIIGTIFSIIFSFIHPVSTDNEVWNALLGIMWANGDTSYFPFFNWLFYPLIGVALGNLLIRCTNKKSFYKRILLLSGAGLIMSLVTLVLIQILAPNGQVIDAYEYVYYHHKITGNLFIGSISLAWLSLIFFIRNAFGGFLKKILLNWSKNLTTMYVIHWVTIGVLIFFFGYYSLNIVQCVIIMPLLIIFTDRMAAAYKKVVNSNIVTKHKQEI